MKRSILMLALLALAGCKSGNETKGGEHADQPAGVTGLVAVDGSSTVFPITEAVAEEFQKENNSVKVTVGISGTGGGFKKFCAGETDISDASRPIKQSEIELCAKNGIEYVELPVAFDGLAVLVHPKNDWAKSMTVEELKSIWQPEAQGKVTKWSQVRKGFPAKDLRLYGPGVDSGTYDYFTEVVVGKEHSSRGDYTSSEDDNVLVQGIAGDEGALGFFGYAYYEENKDKLKLVAIDDGKKENGDGPIEPSTETVRNGTYRPLSRPIFIYVAKKSLETKPQIAAFTKFYLAHSKTLTAEVGYVPLPDAVYTMGQKRVDEKKTGTLFGDKANAGLPVEEVLQKGANPGS